MDADRCPALGSLAEKKRREQNLLVASGDETCSVLFCLGSSKILVFFFLIFRFA